MSCPYVFSRNIVIIYSIICISFGVLGLLEVISNIIEAKDKLIASSELVAYLLFMFPYVCLYVGSLKGSRNWMLPYLIVHIGFSVGTLIIITLPPVYLNTNILLVVLGVFVLRILIFIGIYGHYKNLGNERTEPAYNV